MEGGGIQLDLETARRICRELLRGNRGAVSELYHAYQMSLERFARRILYDLQRLEDVLQSFWLELLNGRTICSYNARNQASLRV